MDQLPLENILASAQVAAPQAVGFVAVGEAALDQFAAPFQQPFAVIAPYSLAILIGCPLLFGLASPATLALLPLLRNVAAHAVILHSLQNRATQIVLVCNQFFDATNINIALFNRGFGLVYN